MGPSEEEPHKFVAQELRILRAVARLDTTHGALKIERIALSANGCDQQGLTWHRVVACHLARIAPVARGLARRQLAAVGKREILGGRVTVAPRDARLPLGRIAAKVDVAVPSVPLVSPSSIHYDSIIVHCLHVFGDV